MSELWLIRITFAYIDEAISACTALVEEKLAACANISDGVTSLYRWEGKMRQEKEVSVILKTTEPRVPQAIARLKQLHPYDLPAITAWKADIAEPGFAAWVHEETVV